MTCLYCGTEVEDLIPCCAVCANDHWAATNRVMCDFFHRAKPLPRLPATEREPVGAIVLRSEI